MVSEKVAKSLYIFFRCGLLHEGHIKKYGQFCFDEDFIREPILDEQGFVVVNPKYLYQAIEEYFINFIDKIKGDEPLYNIFQERLIEDFEDEINKAKGN